MDALIPGFEPDIYSIIRRGVVEDKDLVPPITDNRNFNIGIIRCNSGKGASRHIHKTTVPVHRVAQLRRILHEAIPTQYDTVSVLIGPRHGSKKVGEGSAIILAIIGGTNLGKVLCHRKP